VHNSNLGNLDEYASMNPEFFDNLQLALASERMDAYRQDEAEPLVTLARYLWNMALCESLYSPLQIAEIALRNALHRKLTIRFGTENWFDDATCRDILSHTQQHQIDEAKQTLTIKGKPISPGRMVAELTFGFWTAFFNKRFAQNSAAIAVTSGTFHAAPKAERDLRKLNQRWRRIRELRNRVFHHERIIHWADLEAQHTEILRVIGWISPELQEMAQALDRFTEIRQQGVAPWTDKICHHWPHRK